MFGTLPKPCFKQHFRWGFYQKVKKEAKFEQYFIKPYK